MKTTASRRLTISLLLLLSSAVFLLGSAPDEAHLESREFKVLAFAKAPVDEPYQVGITIEDVQSHRIVGKPPVLVGSGEPTILEAFDPESGTLFKIEISVSTEVSESVKLAVDEGRMMRFPVATDKPDF